MSGLCRCVDESAQAKGQSDNAPGENSASSAARLAMLGKTASTKLAEQFADFRLWLLRAGEVLF